jgi:DNA-binding winged helix-turn-helix (wHTH) protein/TolB-like protein
MSKDTKHFYEFGPFRFDPEEHRLLRNGELVHLPPKSMDALIVFVQNAGKLLVREALMQAVWADSFVEDANLTVAISNLRKALGQNGETAEYIETIPRVGYRFVAEVYDRSEQSQPLIIEKHTQSRTVIQEEEFGPDATKQSSSTSINPQQLPATKLAVGTSSRRILMTAATVVVVAVGSFIYFHRADQKAMNAANPTLIGIKSLAVLPPKSFGSESENAALSLGIADALITRLGSVNKLIVRPTESVARYTGTNQDPLKAGSALGVDAILDGTLQRNGGRTRVTLRLLEVSSGRQMWAANFDEADSDFFKLQDSISQQVGNALYANLTTTEQAQLTRQQTTNKDAYASYLQGIYFWSKRGSEARKGADYFRKAIELDPKFAEAYVGLAAVEAATSPIPSPEAQALVEKAMELDDSLADAHATYAFIRMFHYWDWPTAERELDRAIELNPNSAVAHHWKGVYLSIRGRLGEAKTEMYRALDLDPLSLIVMTDIGQLHYFAHEYDLASDYCNRALAFDPQFHDAHTYLVDIYQMKGMDREALNELIQADSIEGKGVDNVKQLFAREGLRGVFTENIQDELRMFNKESDKRSLFSLIIARYYARIGEKEEALKYLAIAVEKPQTFWTPYIAVDPIYDTLRSDPRFKQMLNRLGLTGQAIKN